MSGPAGKPNIVFLSHWAKSLGGAELSLIDLIKKASEFANVQLIVTEPGTLQHRIESCGIKCTVINCNHALVRIRRGNLVLSALSNIPALVLYAFYISKIRSFLIQSNPDIAHANVPKSHITLLLCKLLGFKSPVVLHMREIFPANSPVSLLYKGLMSSTRNVSVIAISYAVASGLPENLKNRSIVCHNGVQIPPAAITQPKLPFKLLYLGRIVPWKGCTLLVNAFAGLLKRIDNTAVTLTLAGGTFYWDASYREELKELISARKLTNRIHMLDAVENPIELLLDHHVLCLPSVQEPFGRVAAEAHACGLPVIASNSGGLPEIVEHGQTGILFRENDINELTSAMIRLIEEPGLAIRMGKNARLRAERFFDVDRQTEKLVAVLMDRAQRSGL